MGIKTNRQKQQFSTKSSIKPNLQIQHKTIRVQMEERDETNKYRTIFTCYRPQLNKITNLVKRTNVGIAFRNTNTLQQVPRHKRIYETTEHDKSESKNILATFLIDHTSV